MKAMTRGLFILFLLFFSGCIRIELEKIYFNHDEEQYDKDAINIKINCTEDVRIPEWEKGKKAYPAAYIKSKKCNEDISVMAVFSAKGIKSATIWAESKEGELGDLEKRVVDFNKKGLSRPIVFKVNTPKTVKAFDQVWEWYCRDINGIISVKVPIARSKNKIYILLEEPKPPWENKGEAVPWADALEYSCTWAEGATNQVCAAIKITKHLYNDIGGYYEKESWYTNNEYPDSPFGHTKFLDRMPSPFGVGGVNCYDMAKALVAFSTALGCEMSYRYIELYGNYLKCIKPIGLSNHCLNPVSLSGQCSKTVGLSYYCNEYFENHAYGYLDKEKKVFDPTFKAYIEQEKREEWLINIPESEYANKILHEEGAPSISTEVKPKSLEDNVTIQCFEGQQFKLFLQWLFTKVLKIFDCINEEKVIPGIKIDSNTFRNIVPGIDKYDYSEGYRFIKSGISYSSVIHKLWYTKDGKLLDVTTYVYPDSASALKYLIQKFFYHFLGLFFYNSTEPDDEDQFSIKEIKIHNIIFEIKVGGDLKNNFCDIVKKLKCELKNQCLVDKSKLKDILNITLSSETHKVKKRNNVRLCLKVENRIEGKSHCFWRTSKGCIENDEEGNFFYCGEDEGNHTIKIIAVNEVGLLASDEIDIRVEDH